MAASAPARPNPSAVTGLPVPACLVVNTAVPPVSETSSPDTTPVRLRVSDGGRGGAVVVLVGHGDHWRDRRAVDREGPRRVRSRVVVRVPGLRGGDGAAPRAGQVNGGPGHGALAARREGRGEEGAGGGADAEVGVAVGLVGQRGEGDGLIRLPDGEGLGHLRRREEARIARLVGSDRTGADSHEAHGAAGDGADAGREARERHGEAGGGRGAHRVAAAEDGVAGRGRGERDRLRRLGRDREALGHLAGRRCSRRCRSDWRPRCRCRRRRR